MVLGKLPVPRRPTIWIIVEQGPIALAEGAGGGCLDIFTILYLFSPLSLSFWETDQYRLKYYHKGPLNPKQPTNQPTVQNPIFCPVPRNFLFFLKTFSRSALSNYGSIMFLWSNPLSGGLFTCFLFLFNQVSISAHLIPFQAL